LKSKQPVRAATRKYHKGQVSSNKKSSLGLPSKSTVVRTRVRSDFSQYSLLSTPGLRCNDQSVKKLSRATDSLLSREDFRRQVFARDRGLCVVCGAPAQDAHHILERRLFDDGGYYLSNGAALCAQHHIEAEKTTLSVETIREKVGINAPALPSHFHPDERYDKWGNIILSNGRRTKGELFDDESVQKILRQGGVLGEFTDYVKYPRTLHLPWSPGATDDDRVHPDVSGFVGEEVVVTEKMDGENTTLYRDHYHARSIDSSSHPSQSWARALHARIAWQIPVGWRICAENLYAKHSIAYDSLASFLLVFSVWNEKNRCMDWDATLQWCAMLHLQPVPLLYRGPWEESVIRKFDPVASPLTREGYVVRVTREFAFGEFRRVVGKYVRAHHVQTSHDWRRQAIMPNRMQPS